MQRSEREHPRLAVWIEELVDARLRIDDLVGRLRVLDDHFLGGHAVEQILGGRAVDIRQARWRLDDETSGRIGRISHRDGCYPLIALAYAVVLTRAPPGEGLAVERLPCRRTRLRELQVSPELTSVAFSASSTGSSGVKHML